VISDSHGEGHGYLGIGGQGRTAAWAGVAMKAGSLPATSSASCREPMPGQTSSKGLQGAEALFPREKGDRPFMPDAAGKPCVVGPNCPRPPGWAVEINGLTFRPELLGPMNH